MHHSRSDRGRKAGSDAIAASFLGAGCKLSHLLQFCVTYRVGTRIVAHPALFMSHVADVVKNVESRNLVVA